MMTAAGAGRNRALRRPARLRSRLSAARFRLRTAPGGVCSVHTPDTTTSEVTVKEKLGPTNALYPLVTAIVGATVDGRPDFATIAHVGIAHLKGITLGMGNVHLTNKGIIENGTFSVNLPSESMVAVTDHIGMVSGTKEDKSGLFELFYGELDTAPMIQQCKVTMECRLIDHVKLPTHDLFVGEVVGTYADVEVLTNGLVDIAKLRPLLFDMASKKYWALGDPVAKCWSVGKEFVPQG
jgi:flavin reductase (DIM6/NTAB) family NADH-FMN oxidoreductase RutF